jgi:hypothetical protein
MECQPIRGIRFIGTSDPMRRIDMPRCDGLKLQN